MNKFRLISLKSDEIHAFDSVRALCDYILDTSLEKGEYYVIETKVTNEKFDPTHDLARVKDKRKQDKSKDIEGEIIQKPEPRIVHAVVTTKKKPKISH